LALLRGAHKLLGTVNGKALEMLLVIVLPVGSTLQGSAMWGIFHCATYDVQKVINK